MATEITVKERQAAEALEVARCEGATLRAYAQAQGLSVQDLYDGIASLRRKGLLARPTRQPQRKFVAVRIEPQVNAPIPIGRSDGISALCRIVHPGGYLIECMQWPPSSWLVSLSLSPADAAA